MVRTALSPAEVDQVWRRWWSGQAVRVLARESAPQPLDRAGPAQAHRWDPAGAAAAEVGAATESGRAGGGLQCSSGWVVAADDPGWPARRPRRSLGRSPAMAAESAIGARRLRTRRRGRGRPAEADEVGSLAGCGQWSRTSLGYPGNRRTGKAAQWRPRHRTADPVVPDETRQASPVGDRLQLAVRHRTSREDSFFAPVS